MRWQPATLGDIAYAGKRILGHIVPLGDGEGVAWEITAVSSSRYQKIAGRAPDEASAKRSLEMAWDRWLRDRGLQDVSP